ncbi:MAG: CRISPR-associated RAMP protein Csx7 [Nitrososphaerota archaeon]
MSELRYPPWISHSILIRQVELGGRLRTLEPLRIGVGKSDLPSATTDMPVIRLTELRKGLEVPYIPGSSLKGLFRSAAESIAKSANIKPEPCSGLSKDNCMVIRRVDGETLGNLIERFLKIYAFQEAISNFWENACLLCKVFGAPMYRSKVTLQDAYPIDENGELTSVPTGIKTGIAIDRSTGAVYGGALYRIEYVEPGALFSFALSANNLPNYALGLLVEVLTMLNDGLLRIGGFKSRGFGRVEFDDIFIKVKHFSPISGDEDVLNTLGDSSDRKVTVKPSESKDGQLIYKGNELRDLLDELRRVWKDYVFSISKG